MPVSEEALAILVVALLAVSLANAWRPDKSERWAAIGVPAGFIWFVATLLGVSWTRWQPAFGDTPRGWGYVAGAGTIVASLLVTWWKRRKKK